MKRRLGFFAALLLTLLAHWPVSAAPESVPLNMGFYLPAIREANMADLKISLGVWVEEVGKPYGVKINASTFEDMGALRRALDRAELNFINAPGMEMAEMFAPDEIRQGYARRHHGVDEGLALVVNKASGIQRFADLQGKRLSRLSADRLSDAWLEVQCLKAASLECREFIRMNEEKRDIQSVYSVFFGRADAALVQIATLRTAIELNPQIGQRLTMLSEWKAKAVYFGMMTRHTDERYRSLILKSSREALKTPRGQQLPELFKTDYLEPVDADALKPYWALLRELQELRRGRGKKR